MKFKSFYLLPFLLYLFTPFLTGSNIHEAASVFEKVKRGQANFPIIFLCMICLNKMTDAGDTKVDKTSIASKLNETPSENELKYSSALHLYSGKYASIQKVIELLKKGIDANLKDKDGLTPLHASAAYGQVKIIQYLIESGAMPNAKDKYLQTPLHSACWQTQTLAAQALIKAGADVNALDRWGRSPLYATATNGGCYTANLLIKHGAKEDIYIASMIGDTAFVNNIIKKNPKIIFTIDKRNDEGESPLHWAAKRNHADLVKLLIVNGLDPDIKDNSGNTPINIASLFDKNIESILTLIENRCTIDIPNNSGFTALHRSTVIDAYKITRLLCQNGHNVNPLDNEKNSPLHKAVEMCSLNAAKILIEFNASQTIKNNNGKTPFEMINEGLCDKKEKEKMVSVFRRKRM